MTTTVVTIGQTKNACELGLRRRTTGKSGILKSQYGGLGRSLGDCQVRLPTEQKKTPGRGQSHLLNRTGPVAVGGGADGLASPDSWLAAGTTRVSHLAA